MSYLLDLLVFPVMITPCCILSIVFARRHRPFAGGALALVKLFSTLRAGKILEEMLRSSGKIGWQRWGFGYAPAGTAVLVSVLVISIVCVVLNLCVFVKLRRTSLTARP